MDLQHIDTTIVMRVIVETPRANGHEIITRRVIVSECHLIEDNFI